MSRGLEKQVVVYVGATDDPDIDWEFARALFFPLNADIHGNIFSRVVIDVGGVGTAIQGGNLASDNLATSLIGINVRNFSYLFDGLNWDRQRANQDLTLLASAARTVTNSSADFTNNNSRGAHFQWNITAVPGGADTITLAVQGKDPVSGTYYDILVSTAQAGTISVPSIIILKVYPGIGQIVNGAASDILPRTYRVEVRHSGATSFTYSVGASLIV